jgi:hypothetical protein
MLDHDIGEMFLNFPMHESIQPFSGIDVRPYCYPGSAQTHIERWVRCMMGWVAAPYVTTQSLALAKEVIYGDQTLPDNPYGWTRVILNLPGQPGYTPTLPWVRRVTSTGGIASDSPIYVDDARVIGNSLSTCRQAGHRFATGMCYLGIQVAARKVRPPSQQPGAWAGAVALVGPEGVGVTCLPEKWIKAQTIVADTLVEVRAGGLLHHKTLEQRRGFLNHIQRVFPAMTPFLKGFHLTLDGWRPGRDEDLWKTADHLSEDRTPHLLEQHGGPPEWVTPASRLQDDLQALEIMFQGSKPAVRLLRPTRMGVAVYGFGDASGAGFGSAFTQLSSIWFCYGVWGSDAEDASSNYRELCNLTEAIELGVQQGRLSDCELFIYTDNTTAEAAYYKGNSDSRLLFELVVRLRRLDMAGSLRLHVTHIAGSRMIASGVDGLSRGNVTEGLMLQPSVATFASFVPLHLSALTRSPSLLAWLRSWIRTFSLRTVGGDRVKHYLTSSPTQSTWFERFSGGCIRRMGQDVRQDWAIPLPAMHALMDILEREWLEAQDLREKSLTASIGAYSLIAFCGSFRGNEVFLTDLYGLRKYCFELATEDHVIIPLLGKFKGEVNARYHLAPLAAQTNSGLQVRKWVERLVQVREGEGRLRGPAFCDTAGCIARAYDYEDAIISRLMTIQERTPDIIGREVNLMEEFGVSRSFRRGSTSTARTRGVDDKQVELVNRWRKFERARGRRPVLAMRDHYSDVRILIPEMIKYSQAL